MDSSLGTDNLPSIGALTLGAPALQEVGALTVLLLQVGKQAETFSILPNSHSWRVKEPEHFHTADRIAPSVIKTPHH